MNPAAESAADCVRTGIVTIWRMRLLLINSAVPSTRVPAGKIEKPRELVGTMSDSGSKLSSVRASSSPLRSRRPNMSVM